MLLLQAKPEQLSVHTAVPAFSMPSLLKHVLPMLQHVHTGEAAALCSCSLLIAAVSARRSEGMYISGDSALSPAQLV